MSKLYIMKGLPGCGKTTRAGEIMRETGNTIRINKDSLRAMLHMDKWTGVNEGLTRDAARELAKMFLKRKMNVIIDDTNLNEGTMQSWKDLAKGLASVEVIDMTDVPVEVCVMRDLERAKYVGGTVIKNMALRYGLLAYSPDNVGLCDIAGTIGDIT